jgi:hypothetical protein
VETLVAELQSNDESIRLMAAKALGKLRAQSPLAVAALARAARLDPDEDVRRVAEKSLQIIRGLPGSASPPVAASAPTMSTLPGRSPPSPAIPSSPAVPADSLAGQPIQPLTPSPSPASLPKASPSEGSHDAPAAAASPALVDLLRPATEWKQFSSAEGRFSVLLPGRPIEQRQKYNSSAGEIKTTLFLRDAPRHVSYLVSFIDYPPGLLQPSAAAKLLDYTRDNTLTNTKGKLVSETMITLDGTLDGRQLVIEVPTQQTRWNYRIYALQSRVYQLVVARPAQAPSEEEDQKFLNSFKLLAAADLGNAAASTPQPAATAAPDAAAGMTIASDRLAGPGRPLPSPGVGSTAPPPGVSSTAPPPGGVQRSLVGHWVTRYNGPGGRPLVESTAFQADGGFATVARNEAGQITKNLTGRYAVEDGKVAITVNGESIRFVLTWINDQRFELNFGSGVFTYDRQRN